MVMKNKGKVSAVIPTYNSFNTLKACIISLQKQTIGLMEIIVVDNGSTDGTSKYLRKKFPEVKLVSLKTNTGVTGGRNSGINKASPKSDYILFFDHDMVAEKDMVSKLLKVAEENPLIGVVTPKIYYYEDKKRIWSAGTSINLWTGKIVFRGGRDLGQYEKTEEVPIAPAAMLVKKEVIKKIGGFDNTYYVTYEDTDFCFRAKADGFKIFYTPSAVAFHKISPTLEGEADRLLSRAYWVGRNRIIFMRKFGASFPLFLILFVPTFSLYYLMLAIKVNRITDWLKFMAGTWRGIVNNEAS